MSERSGRLRYAIVGTGFRALLYVDAIVGTHAGDAELVAWGDTNPGRLDFHQARLTERGHGPVPRFDPEELRRAVGDHGIDRVVITSPDRAHAGHIAAALDGGADAVVEKPLTIDVAGVHTVVDAVERTGRDVIVTFNYRYSPRNTALKEIIASGVIGEVTSVHFEWLLDTSHGADYFRRWHRDKASSGGLLVHKSSHHFDLVNWWLGDQPERVYASGGLRFYGAANAARRGLGPRPARGSVDSSRHDRFSLDLRRSPLLSALYLDHEHHDGYRRDLDVFADGITIEDNLALVVDYVGGATLTYSLNAHSPWEGYTVNVNGTAGRAELAVVERGAVLDDESGHFALDPSAGIEGVVADTARPESARLVVQRHWESARAVDIASPIGGHGGGDEALLRDLFVGDGPDPLGRAASWRDGVRAVAVGIAGNESLTTGRPVQVSQPEPPR